MYIEYRSERDLLLGRSDAISGVCHRRFVGDPPVCSALSVDIRGGEPMMGTQPEQLEYRMSRILIPWASPLGVSS